MKNFEIRVNDQYGSHEIYFSEKPAEEVREALKALHFRWNGKKSCWYGFADEETISAAIGNSCAPLVLPGYIVEEPGSLYEGWTGGNCGKWHNYAELKQLLLADFKKAGINVSVRKRRCGYLTSICCIMTISSADILPCEEYIKNARIKYSGWLYYTDATGKICDMHCDNFFDLSAEDQKTMSDNIKRTDYALRLQNMEESRDLSNYDVEILTETARRKFELMQAIVSTYNHDQSNGMIDYFERDIYDAYAVKFA